MAPPSPSEEGSGAGPIIQSTPPSDTLHPNPSPEREGLAVAPERPVTLAVIIGAHGLGGEVRLKLFGEGAEALRGYKAFSNGALTLKAIRPDKSGAIARFAEIPDRSAAERARGAELTVARSALPLLGEGEYYHHDLIGLGAVSSTGEALGTVVLIENFGAGDILEIKRPDGKRFMVPMNKNAVPEWDAARVVIDSSWIV
jgi:16S rRNA processing protein RimM